MIAVSASRKRIDLDGGIGCWRYRVIVVGDHGAVYEIDVAHTDGCEPLPFKACRMGRAPRKLGLSAHDTRERLYSAALAALVS